MLDPVHKNHLILLENLVDDPVVAPPGHGQTFELAQQRLPEPPGFFAIGPKTALSAATRIF